MIQTTPGCEATSGADLLVGEQALPSEAGDLRVHGVTGLHLHAEVVDAAAPYRVLSSTSFNRGSVIAKLA